MAYLVERAHESIKKEHRFIDLRGLDPDQPLPEHGSTLELHNHESLLARLALINSLDIEKDQAPSRAIDEVFVREYGKYILRHSVRQDLAI